ncbi:hypothetical protein GH721_01520 [Kriegella sp. EG-1]|nr:hypothetical protein [Flavobacteriaceae bacterium EG-1]
MIEQRNILRQITDIQVQADRLIKGQGDLTDMENFGRYSLELKTFLTENIQDNFILKYDNQIPTLDLDEESEITDGFIYSILYFFDGILGVYSLEQKKKAKAINVIRDIKGKYASAEFMLKNYFD